MAEHLDQIRAKAINQAADFDNHAVARIPALQKARDVGARPIFIAGGIVGLIFIIFSFIIGPLLTLNIWCCLLPGFMTMRCLRHGTVERNAAQIMTYWTLFSTISLFDNAMYAARPAIWFIAKACVLIGLAKFRGAEFIYNNAITPLIDAVSRLTGSATDKISSLKSDQAIAAPIPSKQKQEPYQKQRISPVRDERKENELLHRVKADSQQDILS